MLLLCRKSTIVHDLITRASTRMTALPSTDSIKFDSSVSMGAHLFAALNTLFLIVDSGMAIRDIPRTDVYRVLKSCRNLRIFIFSPLASDAEFRAEMAGENVVIEPLQQWRAGRSFITCFYEMAPKIGVIGPWPSSIAGKRN